MTTRRGMMLLELLLALALLGLLTTAAVRLCRLAAGAAAGARRALAEERDATALLALGSHDLGHAAALDVAVPVAAHLEYDRPVGEAPGCGLDAGAPLLRAAEWRGSRIAAAGRDEMLILLEADPARWQRRLVVAVGAAACPDGAAAIRLIPDAGVSTAEYVRVIEAVRLRRYAGGGFDWLGLEHRWNGTAVQPFAGPVTVAGWSIAGNRLGMTFQGTSGMAATLSLPLE